jgi:hypothetical protein
MEKERKMHSHGKIKSVAPEECMAIKNVEQLKELYAQKPAVFHNEQILATDDGSFIFINGKFVRLDRNFRIIDMKNVYIPTINMMPAKDRAYIYLLDRQDQFTPEGMLKARSYEVSDRNKKVSKDFYRFIIVRAGGEFSKNVVDPLDPDQSPLKRGDEIIMADHLDGLPHFPLIGDPTTIIVDYNCISLHYSETVGYFRHNIDQVSIELLKD